MEVTTTTTKAHRSNAQVLLSGLISFFLNLANFYVTKFTSAVMLQVRIHESC